jgi:RNA polymerase sporulation-specific sigma factor
MNNIVFLVRGVQLDVFVKENFTAFRNHNDQILVNMANSGNYLAEEYIINKYKKMVKMKARAYFLIGADKEDLIQEGMIGLYKAVRSYDNYKMPSFKMFAEICVNRQIITAVKMASRKKHKPLNFSISLNQPVCYNNSDKTLLDIVSDMNINDPLFLFITQEKFIEIKSKLQEMLSKLEIRVLELYLEGKTYKEIALEINKSVKSIDNAIQRIKSKLEFTDKLN